MIAKGCTIKNTFSIPYAKEEVKAMFITYSQKGAVILEKEVSQCEFGDGVVSVTLSQEDTLKFSDCTSVQIQIRARLENGIATKSNIIQTITDNVLKDGVI